MTKHVVVYEEKMHKIHIHRKRKHVLHPQESSFMRVYRTQINNPDHAKQAVRNLKFIPLTIPNVNPTPCVPLTVALPTDMIVNIIMFLTPFEQSRSCRTCKEFQASVCEVAREMFFQNFGTIPPLSLATRQIVGILQNIHIGSKNVEKAKKILCWSISRGYIKFVRNTLNHKILHCLDSNWFLSLKASQFSHQMPPLYLACRQGYLGIVKLLLSDEYIQSIRINELCSIKSHTSTHIACMRGHCEILDELKKHPRWDVNKPDTINHFSPLTTVIVEYDAVNQMLLSESSSVNSGSDDQSSTNDINQFNSQLFKKLFTVFTWLLNEESCNINCQDKEHRTPLFHASDLGCLELCQLLIDKGAKLNAQSKAGKTPLFAACDNGYYHVAKLLLEKGADIHIKTSRSKTALYATAEKGYAKIAELLLKQCEVEDLFTTTTYGTTPIFIANKQSNKRVKNMFKFFLMEKKAQMRVKQKTEVSAFKSKSNFSRPVRSMSMHKPKQLRQKSTYTTTNKLNNNDKMTKQSKIKSTISKSPIKLDPINKLVKLCEPQTTKNVVSLTKQKKPILSTKQAQSVKNDQIFKNTSAWNNRLVTVVSENKVEDSFSLDEDLKLLRNMSRKQLDTLESALKFHNHVKLKSQSKSQSTSKSSSNTNSDSSSNSSHDTLAFVKRRYSQPVQSRRWK